MPSISNNILAEFEWDEGAAMPVANEENKRLENEVQKKQNEVMSLQSQLTENQDLVHTMSEHLKNVRQELSQTQGIINARKKEIETENHLRKLAEREEGRLKQEVTRMNKELAELKEKRNINENIVFKQTQKLEDLKSQMHWNQEALEAWLEESARKDEDKMILQKYSRQDEGKVKSMTLEIERLTQEAQRKKRKLDNEQTETISAQVALDKTATEFREAHAERQELITQWEQTIEQMEKRDKEIDLLAAQLAEVKREVRQREELIREKEQFHSNEVENNREQELKIAAAERAAVKIRAEHAEAETQCDQLQSELDSLRTTVDRTATDLEHVRAEIGQLKRELVDKKDKLEKAKLLNDDLKEKLRVATDSKMSAEERAARLDEMMSEEERRQQEIEVELKRLREIHFKKSEELNERKKKKVPTATLR